MPWIYLLLIAVVVVFGIGVLLVSRRRAGSQIAPPATPRPRIDKPPQPSADRPEPGGVAVAEPDVVELDVVELDVVEPDVDVVEEIEVVEVVEPEVIERPRFRDRMLKARAALAGVLGGVRSRDAITQETWDDLEEALLRADVGVRVTDELLDDLRQRVKSKEITTSDELVGALRADMVSRLDDADRSLRFADPADGPNVWLFVGVNGVGKTTTIGKVGALQIAEGRSVIMAAGDTFRAAAAEQLGTWAERSGAELVRGSEGGDPSAVIFDAVERAAARKVDLVLADTAGRLHTKTNLMDELRKVRRVAGKGRGQVTEVLLVLDATTGQNGLTQAREFRDATMQDDGVGVTGVVLTKLDGSAKGGIVFAIETEFGLPVKLVGLGESIGDLVPFDPHEFVSALVDD